MQRTLSFGAFGENITLSGMTEEEVCIGDVYQLGEAIVQVSQPRQPCYKLAGKHGVQDLALRILQTGQTGYYFRVLLEGVVNKEEPLRLITRDPSRITVAYANRIKYHDKDSRGD